MVGLAFRAERKSLTIKRGDNLITSPTDSLSRSGTTDVAAPLTSLTIKNFRAFRELRLENLARVNMITGRNNTGKSSVLEALSIFATNGSFHMIGELQRIRGELSMFLGKGDLITPDRFLAEFSSLFWNYELASASHPLSIEGTTECGKTGIQLYMGSAREVGPLQTTDELGTARIPPTATQWSGTVTRKHEDDEIGTDTDYEATVECLRGKLDRQARPARCASLLIHAAIAQPQRRLGRLWDMVALTDREEQVVEALRLIDPSIRGVGMVENAESERIAVARVDRFLRPVALRSLGDGINRLFGIILSMVNVEGGLLLIDEFENGLHHTVQYDAWRLVFQLAKKLDVQVFATSHSWDAVEAFQQAASESEEEDAGLLLRLTRVGDEIVPTYFRGEELEVVAQERIEVR
ncbi:AAA family ATPase [bacterium]|nr:AAA family ATPase [bacterium]